MCESKASTPRRFGFVRWPEPQRRSHRRSRNSVVRRKPRRLAALPRAESIRRARSKRLAYGADAVPEAPKALRNLFADLDTDPQWLEIAHLSVKTNYEFPVYYL